jgi:hypothetical protein
MLHARRSPQSSPSRSPGARAFVAASSALFLLLVAGCDAPVSPMSDVPARDGAVPDAAVLDGGVDVDGGLDARSPTDGGSHDDAGPVSDACISYCECFERDCVGIQGVPGGGSCFAFCATFTPDQWDCRISHCRLVVPESNPNHCMHAVGIDQCL